MWEPKRNGIRLLIKETGEEFNSIRACASYLGVDVSWLGKVTRRSNGYCTCHGYHIIRLDEPDYLENYDYDKTEYRGRRGLKIKIVETGETFNSVTECARAINGSPGTIYDAIHNKRCRKTHKGFHFELI